MKKMLMLAALAMSISAGAIAQESGSGTSTGTTGGSSDTSSGAGGNATGGDAGAGNTTNAPNAPFLGNRDMIGAFYTDDSMTTLRTGDEFKTAYQALSDEDRTRITEECKSPAGFERFCDTFMAMGSTSAQ
jgi:type II secretory pathway component GspD/PulD (secretin)